MTNNVKKNRSREAQSIVSLSARIRDIAPMRRALTPLAVAFILTCLPAQSQDSTLSEPVGMCVRATETLQAVVERTHSGDSLVSRDWLYLATHLEISRRVSEMAAQDRFRDRAYVERFDSLLISLLPEMSPEGEQSVIMRPADDLPVLYEMVAVAQTRSEHHILKDCRDIFADIGCPDTTDWRLILNEAIEPAMERTFERALSLHPELALASSTLIDYAKDYVRKMRRTVVEDCWASRTLNARKDDPPGLGRP